MKRITAGILSVLCLFCSRGMADPTDSIPRNKEKEQNLEEVLVTASAIPRPIKSYPIITRVIGKKQLAQMNLQTVKDVLEYEIPGLEFTAHGGNSNIKLYGLTGNYVLFLIDGNPIAGETLNNIDYSRLNIQDVKRIEIVKGPASALYGSNAVSAVINIITDGMKEGWGGSAYLRGESKGHYSYGGSARMGNKNIKNKLMFDSKNYRSYTLGEGENSFPVEGSNDWSITDKAVWSAGEKLTVNGDVGYFQREHHTAPPMGLYKHNFYRGYTASARCSYKPGDKSNLIVQYKYDRYNKYDYLLKYGTKEEKYVNEKQLGRVQYNHSFSSKATMNLGGEISSEGLKTYMFKEKQSMKRMTNGAFYLQQELFLNAWALVGGVRTDVHSSFGTAVSPKLSAMYRNGGLTLRTSYAFGFRAPSLKELYANWDHGEGGGPKFQLVGNPDLKAEKSRSFFASAQYDFDRVSLSATFFRNRVKNRITTLPVTHADKGVTDTTFYANIAHAKVMGVDAILTYRPIDRVNMQLAYTYVKDEQTGETGMNIAPSRPHSATLQMGYDYKCSKNLRGNALLQGKYLCGVNTPVLSLKTLSFRERIWSAGYTLWRLTGNIVWKERYTFSAGIDNLFDYRPRRYLYNSPFTNGISFYTKLNIEI